MRKSDVQHTLWKYHWAVQGRWHPIILQITKYVAQVDQDFRHHQMYGEFEILTRKSGQFTISGQIHKRCDDIELLDIWNNYLTTKKMEINMDPKKCRFGRWFPYSIGWFFGSMLIFRGGTNFGHTLAIPFFAAKWQVVKLSGTEFRRRLRAGEVSDGCCWVMVGYFCAADLVEDWIAEDWSSSFFGCKDSQILFDWLWEMIEKEHRPFWCKCSYWDLAQII